MLERKYLRLVITGTLSGINSTDLPPLDFSDSVRAVFPLGTLQESGPEKVGIEFLRSGRANRNNIDVDERDLDGADVDRASKNPYLGDVSRLFRKRMAENK